MKHTFRELVELLYYQGRTAVDILAADFTRYHHAGPSYAHESSALHDHIAAHILRIEDGQDLRNAILVICADLLVRECQNDEGLSASLARERFGAVLAQVVTLIRGGGFVDRHHDRLHSPVTANELFRLVSLFVPDRLPDLLSTHNAPPPLPLVDHIRARFGALHPSVGDLAGIQHLFGSTATLFRILAEGRVPPHRVHLLGKPYSTNHAAVWSLRAHLGFSVHRGSFEYRGIREYHEEADEHAATLLRIAGQNALREGSRVVLIDDGARAIRLLHTPEFSHLTSSFVCVEQTRRGIRELHDVDLRLPVVNVAESRVKLTIESPIIAESVRFELLRKLAELETVGVPRPPSALVIGYGAIGECVALALRDARFDVGVFDDDASKIARAHAAGFTIFPRLADGLAASRLVVGCTGNASVPMREYRHFADESILVSASSSDIEFEAWRLRALARSLSHGYRVVDDFNLVYERFGARLLHLGDMDHPCHFLHIVRYLGKRIFLLNGGFPVNFTGEPDPIAPERIQLTRALLYAGAVQASRSNTPGLIPLDEGAQHEIETAFANLVPR